MKLAPASVATAFASMVFPVPGGPNSRIPLHGCKEKGNHASAFHYLDDCVVPRPPLHKPSIKWGIRREKKRRSFPGQKSEQPASASLDSEHTSEVRWKKFHESTGSLQQRLSAGFCKRGLETTTPARWETVWISKQAHAMEKAWVKLNPPWSAGSLQTGPGTAAAA
jgi:hypothetical protein